MGQHKIILASPPGCACDHYAVYRTNEMPREVVETNRECPMHGVPTYETIKDAQIEALAIDHMRHFRNLIKRAQAGEKGIREDECMKYLKCWRSIYAKVRRYKNPKNDFIRREEFEIRDAIDSDDYDDLLVRSGDPTYVQDGTDEKVNAEDFFSTDSQP